MNQLVRNMKVSTFSLAPLTPTIGVVVPLGRGSVAGRRREGQGQKPRQEKSFHGESSLVYRCPGQGLTPSPSPTAGM